MQRKLGKLKNMRKNFLIKEINRIQNYRNDEMELIPGLEQELNLILDAEFRNFVIDNKTFSVVNNEKPTEHFLNLAKAKKVEAKLGDVLNENG
jgi:hypothetical protein